MALVRSIYYNISQGLVIIGHRRPNGYGLQSGCPFQNGATALTFGLNMFWGDKVALGKQVIPLFIYFLMKQSLYYRFVCR
jgi:hypothetical protein